MLPEVEGKKVYVDDTFVGTIKKLTYDDVGNQIVIIETVFKEMPTLQIEVVKLRKTTREGEEAFTLKVIPIKLRELIEKKKLEEEMIKAEEEIAKEEIPIIEEKPEVPPPLPPKPVEKEIPPKKKSIWQRIIEFFKKLFRRGGKKEKKEETESSKDTMTELHEEIKSVIEKKE